MVNLLQICADIIATLNHIDLSFSSSFCHRGVISLKHVRITRTKRNFKRRLSLTFLKSAHFAVSTPSLLKTCVCVEYRVCVCRIGRAREHVEKREIGNG